MDPEQNLEKYFQKIREEFLKSKTNFSPFKNIDHVYGVLMLKNDDLKDAIKKRGANFKVIEHELIQIANIALRSLIEIIEPYYEDLEFEKIYNKENDLILCSDCKIKYEFNDYSSSSHLTDQGVCKFEG